MQTTKISVFKSDDGLEKPLRDTLHAAEYEKYVKGKVFLKPNICAEKYISGAVTNPELLFHLVNILRDKAEEVILGESDGYNYSCKNALEKTGIKRIVNKAGGKIINLSEDKTQKIQNPKTFILKNISLPKTLLEADTIISVPVMKTHEFTLYSGAIKNLFGCIPDKRRIYLHPHIELVLHDLMLLLNPKFAIIDGTIAMEGNGPNRGIPVPMNIILASNNLLALDQTTANIMKINPVEVTYLEFIKKHLPPPPRIEVIGERTEDLEHTFIRPYQDLAVKEQNWVYKHYILTRFVFGTPLLKALEIVMKLYRRVDMSIKGKEWKERHWSTPT